jgi:hypothetical protein
MQITNSEATQGLMYHKFAGGEKELIRTDGSAFRSYKTNSAKNINATHPIEALMIAVPEKYHNIFLKSY